MTPQSKAIQLVISSLNTVTGYNVKLTPLTQDGGISAEITGGEPKGRYLKIQHGKEDLTVLFLCKNKNQQTAYDTLCTIGNTLNVLDTIEGDNVNVMGAGVRSGASLVGKEGDYYIYSMIARISINIQEVYYARYEQNRA